MQVYPASAATITKVPIQYRKFFIMPEGFPPIPAALESRAAAA
jgi:hypothetical protein